ncbi:MAG: winged helix-turn-helix domain-containing protein [Halieaceae bacterium]|nr:winged helix-turn-helix domain-containing protein [Halieaceae bacterium]
MSRSFSFAHFTADPAQNTLLNEETDVTERVEPRTMQVLVLLAANSGEVVNREAFADIVWAGRRVVSDSLSQCISELRTLLGDNARNPEYIRTVPKRGYAFLQTVTWDEPKVSNNPPEAFRPQSEELPKVRRIPRWIILSIVGVLIAGGMTVRHFADSQPADMAANQPIPAIESLLTLDHAGPASLSWPLGQQSNNRIIIERNWLSDSRLGIEIRDDTDTVVWRTERPFQTSDDRDALRAELSAVLALIKSQQSGSVLNNLPGTEARQYRLARHHLDRRTPEDLDVAEAYLEKVLAHNPDYVDAVLLKAEIYRAKSRHDRSISGALAYRDAAEALIKQAARVAPEHPAVKAMNFRAGRGETDWAADEAYLKSLLSEAPDCTGCARQLSDFYLQVGWLEEALAVWESHKTFWPLSVEVHANIARISANLGLAHEALQQVALIKALAGNSAWDVTATELDAYAILNDEDRWLSGSTQLLESLGERGELRMQVVEATLANDEEQLQILAQQAEAFRNPHMAILLGRVDLIAERLEQEVAVGNYIGFRTLNGYLWTRNAITQRYLDGLEQLRRHPTIQRILQNSGLKAFWADRNKLPDLCDYARVPPPYCQ